MSVRAPSQKSHIPTNCFWEVTTYYLGIIWTIINTIYILIFDSTGYVLLVEVKSSQKGYQKATKQMFDGKERLEEILSALGITAWKYVGVFYAQIGIELPLFDCQHCSIFAIIGKDEIPDKLKKAEEEVMNKHENWNPSDHIEEFIELVKNLLFIAQGDPYAPVTKSNIITKTTKHVHCASNVENIFLWTPEQLSLIQALNLLYIFLNAFYSTGKTEVLKYYGKRIVKKRGILHYFNHRPIKMRGSSNLLPFTLMLQGEFPEGVVKETTFEFGVDSVEDFLRDHGIESDHYVIFDELICTKYTKGFLDSVIAMKNSVKSLWVAMGAQPITGNKKKINFERHT